MLTRGRFHTNARIFTRACWTLIDRLPILDDAVVRGGGVSFAWVRERERHLNAYIIFVDPVDCGSLRNVHHQFSVRKDLDRYLRRASRQRAKQSEHYQLHKTPHTLFSSSLWSPGFRGLSQLRNVLTIPRVRPHLFQIERQFHLDRGKPA